MHDLNQINKQNNQASLASIPQHLVDGKYVVAEYHGLHFMDCEAFATEEAAQAKVEKLNATGGSVHAKLFKPAA